MQKIFIGEVIASELAEFTDGQGELIKNWKLSIALNDEKAISFYVSHLSELFTRVQDAVVGMNVKATCEPKAKMNGDIKWKLVSLEQA